MHKRVCHNAHNLHEHMTMFPSRAIKRDIPSPSTPGPVLVPGSLGILNICGISGIRSIKNTLFPPSTPIVLVHLRTSTKHALLQRAALTPFYNHTVVRVASPLGEVLNGVELQGLALEGRPLLSEVGIQRE